MKPFEIMIYGLNEMEIKRIEAIAAKRGVVYSTDSVTDLIATVSDMIICSSSENLSTLFDFYQEIGYFSETVILIGDIVLPKALRNKVNVFADFEEMEIKFKYMLMDANRKQRKNENFSATLANAIFILSSIRNSPGISTSELAEKLEISTRSVQRYIETLRIAGEWIEYAPAQKGWKLSAGKSVLWGDFNKEAAE